MAKKKTEEQTTKKKVIKPKKKVIEPKKEVKVEEIIEETEEVIEEVKSEDLETIEEEAVELEEEDSVKYSDKIEIKSADEGFEPVVNGPYVEFGFQTAKSFTYLGTPLGKRMQENPTIVTQAPNQNYMTIDLGVAVKKPLNDFIPILCDTDHEFYIKGGCCFVSEGRLYVKIFGTGRRASRINPGTKFKTFRKYVKM